MRLELRRRRVRIFISLYIRVRARLCPCVQLFTPTPVLRHLKRRPIVQSVARVNCYSTHAEYESDSNNRLRVVAVSAKPPPPVTKSTRSETPTVDVRTATVRASARGALLSDAEVGLHRKILLTVNYGILVELSSAACKRDINVTSIMAMSSCRWSTIDVLFICFVATCSNASGELLRVQCRRLRRWWRRSAATTRTT